MHKIKKHRFLLVSAGELTSGKLLQAPRFSHFDFVSEHIIAHSLESVSEIHSILRLLGSVGLFRDIQY